MAVVEPIGTWWQELRAALAESPTGTLRHDGVWEAQISEGNPVVCLLIGSRWWKLGLKHTRSIGQTAALEKIVSGAAIAGELFFHCGPVKDAPRADGSVGDFTGPFRILCRMQTWLPRELARDTARPRDALAARVNQFDPIVLQLERISIEVLRKAICANRVSFPSQVPTFTRLDLPDLERRLVQLYFVSGWTCADIGVKYKLTPGRVLKILDSWKRRAVKVGYIQYIPQAEDSLGLGCL
jgi:hypothetical protein